MNLSYTSCQKYLFCPKQWEYHYREYIRPTTVGSPLFFGNAVDDAFGNLLLSIDGTEKDNAEQIFLNGFNKFIYNRQEISIKNSLLCTYSNTDFDDSILLEEDWEEFNDEYEVEEPLVFFEEAKDLKRKGLLKENDLELYNFMCWLSLKRKGIMLVQAYRDLVLPQIEKVYGVQVPVKLPNESGDQYTGYIDAIVSFKDEPGIKYVMDNKTSSKAYKNDSVAASEQLASYCEFIETDKAAYCVAEKNIRKKEPRVRINIIKDTIKEEAFDSVFYEIDSVLEGIKEEKFERNFDSGCFQFGQRCPYYEICRGNGSMKGLISLKRKRNE